MIGYIFIIIVTILLATSNLLPTLAPFSLLALLLLLSLKDRRVFVLTVIVAMVCWRNIWVVQGIASICMTYSGDKDVRRGVTKLFKDCFNLRTNFDQLSSNPTIFVVNYPYSVWDYVTVSMIPHDIAYVMSDSWITRQTWARVMNDAVFRKKKNGNSYDDVKRQIEEKMNNGKSILAYVTTKEFKNEDWTYIGRVRTGMFRIAKDLGVSITPVAIDTVHSINGVICNQNFRMHSGEPITVDDPVSAARKVRKFFVRQLRDFSDTKFVTDHS